MKQIISIFTLITLMFTFTISSKAETMTNEPGTDTLWNYLGNLGTHTLDKSSSETITLTVSVPAATVIGVEGPYHPFPSFYFSKNPNNNSGTLTIYIDQRMLEVDAANYINIWTTSSSYYDITINYKN